MLRFSRLLRIAGGDAMQKGIARTSALAVDFTRECNAKGVAFHAPLIFGLRDCGTRGIFLAGGHTIRRNTTVLTVPFDAFLTTATDTGGPISFERLEQALMDSDKEFRCLSHHLYLAINMARRVHEIHSISSSLRAGSVASSARDEDTAQTQGVATADDEPLKPHFGWARMLDQEEFDSDAILNNYRASLDPWQLASYGEMTTLFNRQLSSLHSKLELDVPLPLLSRISRVVIARVDHVPRSSYMMAPRWKKWLFQRMGRTQFAARDVALVPFVDMFNHSNKANVIVRFVVDRATNRPVARVTALNDIEGGTEVCRYYNFQMDRANALFRYGFLPFALIGVEKLDPWKEHYAKGVARNLKEEPDHLREERERVEAEVEKLQSVFRAAKGEAR